MNTYQNHPLAGAVDIDSAFNKLWYFYKKYFLGLYILMGQAIEYCKKCITTIVCQYNYTQVILCVIWTGHVASPMS